MLSSLSLGIGKLNSKQKRKVSLEYTPEVWMSALPQPSKFASLPNYRFRKYIMYVCLGGLLFLSAVSINRVGFPRGIRPAESSRWSSTLEPSLHPLHLNPRYLPTSFEIGMVADLDKKSRVEDSSSHKPAFQSHFQRAILHRHEKEGSSTSSPHEQQQQQQHAYDGWTFSVMWKEMETFSTSLNEAGRGFELSELAWFQGHLYSFDDRTGIVFRLEHFGLMEEKEKKKTKEAPLAMAAYPAYIVMEGNGETDKGQKHEWATVKNGELYVGSIGKEFTTADGNVVVHEHNMWVAIISHTGVVRHEDWTDRFAKVRAHLGCAYPGYVIHEAIEWSNVHRQWFLLPRRVSKEPYDDMADETRGSNIIVIASENFEQLETRYVGYVTPERGFSSFKFIPGTGDNLIVAIKSMENEARGEQGTFLTVFDIYGSVLMEETKIPAPYKFEGLAFLHDD